MIRLCLMMYRRLARAFPHEFQIVYGADVIQLGEDVVEEIARTHGILGLVRLVADLAWRVPIEYLAEIRQDFVYAVRMLMKSPGLAVAAVLSRPWHRRADGRVQRNQRDAAAGFARRERSKAAADLGAFCFL